MKFESYDLREYEDEGVDIAPPRRTLITRVQKCSIICMLKSSSYQHSLDLIIPRSNFGSTVLSGRVSNASALVSCYPMAPKSQVVAVLQNQGLSKEQTRARLLVSGFSKSRVSQLLQRDWWEAEMDVDGAAAESADEEMPPLCGSSDSEAPRIGSTKYDRGASEGARRGSAWLGSPRLGCLVSPTSQSA
jgi:hypothetical protein